jgi:hypothetical protein
MSMIELAQNNFNCNVFIIVAMKFVDLFRQELVRRAKVLKQLVEILTLTLQNCVIRNSLTLVTD